MYYGMIIIVSLMIGLTFLYKELKEDQVEEKTIRLYLYTLFILITYGGKLFTMITSKEQLTIITAGLSSYGGAIGLIIALVLFTQAYGKKKEVIYKNTLLLLPLIYSLTKIACLTAGCCYGIEYNGPLHMHYKNLAFNTFPIQIVETICFMIIFLYFKKRKNISFFSEKLIIICAITKFLLDYLRYSHVNIFLSLNQYVSLFFIVFSILLIGIKKTLKY